MNTSILDSINVGSIMNDTQMAEEQLKRLYYDPSSPVSFSSIEKLYNEAKKHVTSIKRAQVVNWLAKQITYTLHRPVRHNFTRNRVIASDIDECWHIDLIDYREFKKFNDDYSYVLVAIDVFSKYAHARALKEKTGVETAQALSHLMNTRQPLWIYSDRGKEFDNNLVRSMLKAKKIKIYFARNLTTKASVAERLIRTLKSRISRYFTAAGTRRWIEVLPKIVSAYNMSYHRSIKLKPAEVSPTNRDTVLFNLYAEPNEAKQPQRMRKKKNILAIGDTIRTAYIREPFHKGFHPLWSDETFTISDKLTNDNQPLYRIKDYSGKIRRKKFYREEIQPVQTDSWRIEKILNKKTVHGRKFYFVKWLGYNDSYNSWIREDKMTDNV